VYVNGRNSWRNPKGTEAKAARKKVHAQMTLVRVAYALASVSRLKEFNSYKWFQTCIISSHILYCITLKQKVEIVSMDAGTKLDRATSVLLRVVNKPNE
jgi:ribosomal protein L32E